MALGREDIKEARRFLNAFEEMMQRGVSALEEISKPIDVQVDAGPPICPHCGKFDPLVRPAADSGGPGRLSDYVIIATCLECQNPFYALPESFSMHRNSEVAHQELAERKESGHFARANNA